MSIRFSAAIMSGNFDFPPATAGGTPASSNDTRRISLDELTRPVNRESNDAERPSRPQQFQPRLININLDENVAEFEATRRQHHEDQAAAHVQTSAMRSRIQASSRLRRRTSSRPQLFGNFVQQAIERLNEASSNLTTLLAQPQSGVASPDRGAREHSGEAEGNRQRKRRKLDNGSLSSGMKGFSYGYKGQVVPGQLKMEITFCDGGLYREVEQNGKEYYPENVLRNDQSVYCTGTSKCNIILRHIGETCFTLKKLVIKAPESGFNAPVQEGLVFITMSKDDILERTRNYELRCFSPNPSDDEFDLEMTENMPENRPPSRRRDSASRSVPAPVSNSRLRPSRLRHASPSPSSSPLQSTNPTSIPSTSPLAFNVTTHCNDPSSDEEEPSSAVTIADRIRRAQNPPRFEFHSSDDDEDTETHTERLQQARDLGYPASQVRRTRRDIRRSEPSRIESTGWMEEDGTAPRLEPHAKFFIEKEKSVVSISFDPSVTGTHILLKLWSPNENIDIQSITAHGFAGPRFFPARQLL